MVTYIYLVENIYEDSNKVYIGKTKESNKHNRKQAHKQKFGKQITFTIIDQINSTDYTEWKPIETYWINQFKVWGFKVFNKNNGGGGPEKLTEGQIFKMKNHPTRGLKIKNNKERAYKISIALKGRKKSQEHRNKIKNRTISQKQIDNIRKAKCKAIIQYDRQGNYINEFTSLIEAANALKVNYQNLTQHVRGYKGCNKTIGGYIFKQKQ